MQSLRFRTLQHIVYRVLFGANLKRLSVVYGTDKWGTHWYAQHYDAYFRSLRKKRLNILEIGIGGYRDPRQGGGSLRTWRTYFPKSKIYGIDIYDKKLHDERRIKTFMGSQVDTSFLDEVLAEIGQPPDIIIDDGSHINEHVIESFKYLFPLLIDGGLYVVEDTQTSYWPEYGGTSDLSSPNTSVGFFKTLVDGLNYEDRLEAKNEATYFDRNIASIHFVHNMIFVRKGVNK
jgi:demethylmacrocin O-methyltransferase